LELSEFMLEVTDWHRATYGRDTPWKALAQKLREEVGELADVMEDWEAMCGEIIEESADVLILLCAINGRHEIDLLAAAQKKFETVKERDQVARDRERGIEVG
jgi:NTP pyrophosphatase (non-canonical NTP hydrolase)